MEEKKLTDEKIVNALKAVGKETLAFAYDKEQRRFEYVTAQEILDIINRQKAEIEELKEMCSKSSYKDSWKNKFFKAQKQVDELKEERYYTEQETAKEILQMVAENYKGFESDMDNLIYALHERYGVGYEENN